MGSVSTSLPACSPRTSSGSTAAPSGTVPTVSELLQSAALRSLQHDQAQQPRSIGGGQMTYTKEGLARELYRVLYAASQKKLSQTSQALERWILKLARKYFYKHVG